MEPTNGVIRDGIVRNNIFSSHAPSPPFVHVPTMNCRDAANTINPSYSLVGPGSLSAADIDIITGGRAQTTNNAHTHDEWRYENRRVAQPILDFLYLGPTSVVRDHDFLRKEGITMIVIVRDASMVGFQSQSTIEVMKKLAMEVKHIDLATSQQLVMNFPRVLDDINTHILRYNTAAQKDPGTHKPAKVLVACQTGNDRSAAIVAAYIMAMYGCNAINAIQFVCSQRFCCNFDETTKYLLFSYEDLLEARRATSLAAEQETAALSQRGGALPTQAATKKRSINDTLDANEMDDIDMDRARYEDRPEFAPYSEENVNT